MRQEQTDSPNGTEGKPQAQPAAQPEPKAQQKKYQPKGETAKKQYKAKQSVVSLDYLENCL